MNHVRIAPIDGARVQVDIDEYDMTYWLEPEDQEYLDLDLKMLDNSLDGKSVVVKLQLIPSPKER